MSDTMREALERWAKEQGFITWIYQNVDIINKMVAWFDREALAARPEASEGAREGAKKAAEYARATSMRFSTALAGNKVVTYPFSHTLEESVDKILACTSPAPKQGELVDLVRALCESVAGDCYRGKEWEEKQVRLIRALLTRQSAEEPAETQENKAHVSQQEQEAKALIADLGLTLYGGDADEVPEPAERKPEDKI